MKSSPYIRLVDFVDATTAIKGATTMANSVATNATNNATSRNYDTAATAADYDDGEVDNDYVGDDNFLHGLATATTAFDKN